MNYRHDDAFGWMARLPTPLVLAVARLGPLGRLKAPGTWGTVAGLLWYTVAFANLALFPAVVLLLLSGWLAVGLCGEAELRLRARDPGEVILDEVVAVPLCFLGLTPWLVPLREAGVAWVVLLAAFGLFRFFDIFKPLGISCLQRFPSGLGVVADDLAAALATNVVLQISLALWLG